MQVLETAKVGADAVLRFDAAGVETWQVQLDPATTYSGAQIAQLQTYCAQNGLQLVLQAATIGVV